MYLMKLIKDLMNAKKTFLYTYLVNTGTLILFYYLLLQSNEVLYPLLLSAVILLVCMVIEGYKFYKLKIKLQDSKVSVETDFNKFDVEEAMVFGTINEIHSEYNQKLYEISGGFNQRNTLFSQWIHNMKTSITVIDLASEKGLKGDKSLDFLMDIIEENNKLKKNLEECLNLLRLDDFSRDYVPEKVNLKQIVLEVVNNKKREFIYTGIFPKVNIEDYIEVNTDKKWCSYIMEQILSNAIKYSKHKANKKVFIEAKESKNQVVLTIKDEGIGIIKEDLPRVFDLFFTGDNGRKDKGSTGIGLYMVKYIAGKLGHKISITSEKEKGTEVEISFLSKV